MAAEPACIAVDWGTSTFRAYLVAADAGVIEEREAPDGIRSAAPAFEATLAGHLEGWSPGLPVLAAGMITSRQGWVEVPYLACPAGLEEIAGGLHRLKTAGGRTVWLVPGLSWRGPGRTPEVMRGEETQILGATGDEAEERGIFVLPGSHSKWARLAGGRITGFHTFMTGEVYAALRGHTILGQLMTSDGHVPAAFAAGVRRGAEGEREAGLLNSLFGTRSLGLLGELPAEAAHSYLSGLLIGAELAGAGRAERSEGRTAVIVGSAELTARYGEAFDVLGRPWRAGRPRAAVAGLLRLARRAGIVP